MTWRVERCASANTPSFPGCEIALTLASSAEHFRREGEASLANIHFSTTPAPTRPRWAGSHRATVTRTTRRFGPTYPATDHGRDLNGERTKNVTLDHGDEEDA